MKQLKLLSLVAILFAATTADSFAQLTKIWEIKNFSASVEALSPHAKLGHLGGFLIDLTNGNIIDTKVNPERFLLTYTGDRYFVSNWQEKTMKVYDRYTKEFIQDVNYLQIPARIITAPDDSTVLVFESTTHTLQFWNVYTNELLDSYKIPGTPDTWTYNISGNPSFSHDGRYFGFSFMHKSDATAFNFMVYDREAKEIVFFETLPISQYSFVYSFMHTSNQLAYGEVVKLEGDDKPYSYIRIFDLNQREVIRNVRVGGEENGVAVLTIRNDDKFILYNTYNDYNNSLYFYNFEQNKVSDFIISPMNSVLIADDNGFVVHGLIAFQFDWTVGVEDTNPISEDLILYPNPSTNSVNLNIDEKYFNGNWQILDLSGRVVIEGIIPAEANLQINIEHLPVQTYFLGFQKENFMVTYKIQKI